MPWGPFESIWLPGIQNGRNALLCLFQNGIGIRAPYVQTFGFHQGNILDAVETLGQGFHIAETEIFKNGTAGGGDIDQFVGAAQALGNAVGAIAEGDSGNGDFFQVGADFGGEG